MEDRRLLSITVNTLIDENDGIGVGGISLREAIAAAAPGDTIDFAPSLTSGGPTTILLTHGALVVNKSLTISGPGAEFLAIDGGGNNLTPEIDGDGPSVIFVDSGFGITADVTISALTVTGGDSFFGGGIYNGEQLTLLNCRVDGNYGSFGGGIYNGGELSVVSSTISGNSSYQGGGIYSSSFSSVTISDSKIELNQSDDSGGGLWAYDSAVAISNTSVKSNTTGGSGGGALIFADDAVIIIGSTFADNRAGGHGGGLSVELDDGNELTIFGSTFSSNLAAVGGGLSVFSGEFNLEHSTISGNSVSSHGGGIHLNEAQAEIRHSTITMNSAGEFGGGVSIVDSALDLHHTIAASNNSEFGRDLAPLFGSTIVSHFSLIGSNAESGLTAAPVASPDVNGNIIGGIGASIIDPKLSALANNGGPTRTHALLPNSPALNSGDPAIAFSPAGYDQRGASYLRVFDGDGVGARIDIGAFEYQPPPPALPGDYNHDGSADAADYVMWRKTLVAIVPAPYDGADGSGNMNVGQEDHGVWTVHFGESLPGSGGGQQAASVEGGVGSGELGGGSLEGATGFAGAIAELGVLRGAQAGALSVTDRGAGAGAVGALAEPVARVGEFLDPTELVEVRNSKLAVFATANLRSEKLPYLGRQVKPDSLAMATARDNGLMAWRVSRRVPDIGDEEGAGAWNSNESEDGDSGDRDRAIEAFDGVLETGFVATTTILP